MAQLRRIKVMISSRENTTVSFTDGKMKLYDLRKELKKTIEAETLFGEALFEVWISEEATQGGEKNFWEESLEQARQADVFVALYNGHAGWARPEALIGICHDELRTALDQAPAKVRVVEVPLSRGSTGHYAKRNKTFREWIGEMALWRMKVESKAKCVEAVKLAIRSTMEDLLSAGSLEVRKGRSAWGTSLKWDLLSFEDRRYVMRKELRSAMVWKSMHKTLLDAPREGVVVELTGDVVGADHNKDGTRRKNGPLLTERYVRKVYFHCDAIPAAMTIPAARELVGQPFLRIREQAQLLENYERRIRDPTSLLEGHEPVKVVGPVHLIACHRTVTEAQAMRILGFPDATIISAPFGIYVADDLQKIQLLFIPGCRSPQAIESAVLRMFMWLEQSGEEIHVAERAVSRRRIIKTIAKEAPDNPK